MWKSFLEVCRKCGTQDIPLEVLWWAFLFFFVHIYLKYVHIFSNRHQIAHWSVPKDPPFRPKTTFLGSRISASCCGMPFRDGVVFAVLER